MYTRIMKGCIATFVLLAVLSSADNMGTDPCPLDTIGYCMNKYALKYTNLLRAKFQISPLISGSEAMFDNAMQHSIDQDASGQIFHQPNFKFGIFVGSDQCETVLSGENVAAFYNPKVKNAAMYCVMELWRKSPGHYKNMVKPAYKSAVIAIYRNNGLVTCTQTFSRDKKESGYGECALALPKYAQQGSAGPSEREEEEGAIEGETDEVKPTPADFLGEEHPQEEIVHYTLKYKSFSMTLVDGTEVKYVQECSSGKCRYCEQSLLRCYRHRASRKLDRIFNRAILV